MKTKTIEINEVFWGDIGYYEMPFPDVYFVSGRKNEGYIVPADYKGAILTPNALSFGMERDGLLYFASGETMCAVEHELLRYRQAHSYNEKEKAFLQDQIESCQQFGQIDLPGYFGEYPPPQRTPNSLVEGFTKVCNGMYFVQSHGQRMFGVCYPIWHSELTEIAQAFGRKKQDYLFFDDVTCAIPLFELQRNHAELKRFIRSQNVLLSLLWKNFRCYILEYNASVYYDEQKIPEAMGETGYDFLVMPQT